MFENSGKWSWEIQKDLQSEVKRLKEQLREKGKQIEYLEARIELAIQKWSEATGVAIERDGEQLTDRFFKPHSEILLVLQGRRKS
ncbi:hypothetical protein [Acinetobacter defluvii]|uniref:hypothetical protein n=1 Tax=Acinetobacter defluvii TaxID=1871111 RepID=UPI003AF4CBFF